jgi:hypothetical protein
MAGIGITDCSLIRASFPAEDQARLARADLILLAGGDVERGWQCLQAVGIPAGGGAVYYPDGTYAALRYPLQEFGGAGAPRALAKDGRA